MELPTSLLTGLVPIILTYTLIEVIFYVSYCCYILPRANIRSEPRPYRDYGHDRLRLLKRVIGRLERTCQRSGKSLNDVLNELIMSYFRHDVVDDDNDDDDVKMEDLPPPLQMASFSSWSSISEGYVACRRKRISQRDVTRGINYIDQDSSFGVSSYEEEDEEEEKKMESKVGVTHRDLRRDNMKDFIGWAFFGKSPLDMQPWEHVELGRILEEAENRLGVVFQPGRNHTFKAKRFTMEDVNSLHRPLVVYAAASCLRWIASAVLLEAGFRRYRNVDGPNYWYRPCSSMAKGHHDTRSPLLFFHGICPGGYAMYLPMILWGLGNDGRAIFLFENDPISCRPVFRGDTEEQTVRVVIDAVNRHVGCNTDVTLCGHSFGSCPITWVIRSAEFKSRIQQIVLLDPVTVLLSEPDVVNNFIYGMTAEGNWLTHAVIRMAASSELFTNHYLRRHFAWYNSELWLEDIPSKTKLIICLAEKDYIINVEKIKLELDMHKQAFSHRSSISHLNVIEWPNVGHGYCVTAPSSWVQIKKAMEIQTS